VTIDPRSRYESSIVHLPDLGTRSWRVTVTHHTSTSLTRIGQFDALTARGALRRGSRMVRAHMATHP
jgi:hypothetical protein